MIAGGILAVGAWAAAAENPQPENPQPENPQPEKVANTWQAASKPAPVDASLPGGRPPERERTVVPQASGTAAKLPLPQLDEKNLGLGCAHD